MPSNSKRSAQTSAAQASQSPASKNAASKSTSSGDITGVAANNVKSDASPKKEQGLSANDNAVKPAPEHQVLQSISTVNRKKQKRRNKQAARLAAERQLQDNGALTQNGDVAPAASHSETKPLSDSPHAQEGGAADEEDVYYTDDEEQRHSRSQSTAQPESNGVVAQPTSSGKRKKKKKGKKNRSTSQTAEGSSTSQSTPLASTSKGLNSSSMSNAAVRSAHKVSKDRIWNTSTQEERENIKEFWLELGEEERRSLVKVEKEAVLRKMKEQQKHSCSCTVCGRKRTAIEEELEVLYDAYYEELEQYANHNHGAFENGAPIGTPRRLYQPPLHSFERHSHVHSSRHPSRGKIQEMPEEEDLEDDYDEEDEEDEPYSDEDLDEATRATRADFFAFGNSLTVKDGILTVADDLLKNDGKHFIDMMEQLAERRMQREEDMQYAAASAAHQSMHVGHNHGPPLDEEDYDDEDEEDYDSQDDEDYEDEMDSMTEEQRMEEGRRMFQIFAARMFEQRVLTAYREKVARERQQKLIEELEEETRLDHEREAKKAREAQKRKDKKRLQKQAKEEERARKEAERAAEEAAKKAEEEKRLEEQRKKKEQQRKKKEAERKAQEEERLRKEAERIKRQREERERQAELERKQREQKEREKKKREEAKKKEREEREAKEREQREKKAKEERERKAREEAERQQKEAAEKADRENKERAKREEQAAQQAVAQAAKRTGHPPIPPGLHPPPQSLHSPHFQVATPIVPKASTPRPRQASHQSSHTSSPRSQPAGADVTQVSISPGGTGASSAPSIAPGKGPQQPILHHPQPSTPMSPLGSTSRAPHPPGFNGMPPLSVMGTNATAPGLGGFPHRFHDIPLYPSHTGQLNAPFRGLENIPLPPGIPPPRPSISGRGFPPETGHTGLPFHPHPPPGHIPSHQPQTTRDGSIAQTTTSLETQQQNAPISRPTPIQRPASTVPHDKDESKRDESDVDELTTQLGSRALLDDTDVPLSAGPSQPIPIGMPPAPTGPGRFGFGLSPFSEPLPSLGTAGSGGTWGTQIPFAPPGFSSPPSWGAGPGWSNNAFGIAPGPHRPHTSRPVAIRLMVIQACKQLTAANPNSSNPGFHDVNAVLKQIEQLNPPNEPPVSLSEMLDICDTEGNPQNGGGSFVIKNEGSNGTFVKFEPDVNVAPTRTSRGSIAPGDIGSPVPGNSPPVPGAAGSSRPFHSSTITPPGF
ncbi:hypothetical protein VTO42DRAFT_4776 [Malbranchea cinnamomea]